MTVAELIDALRGFPADAVVFGSVNDGDDVYHVIDVTPSEDAPEEEVYLELGV